MFLPRLLPPIAAAIMSATATIVPNAASTASVADDSQTSEIPLPPAARFNWTHVGPGGGGNFRGQGISPVNPNLILSSNDMGGSYRTYDGGHSWEMLSYEHIRDLSRSRLPGGHVPQQGIWGFHTRNPRLLFTGSALGFLRSDDAGASWRRIDGHWRTHDGLNGHQTAPRLIVFSFAKPETGLVGFNPGRSDAALQNHGARLYRTTDSGETWEHLSDLPAGSGDLVSIRFVSKLPRRILVATANGVWFGDDDGRTWKAVTGGLPRSSSGGGIHPRELAGSESRGIFYLSFPISTDAGAAFVSGLYRSDDGGETWSPCGTDGLFLDPATPGRFELVATSEVNPERVFLSYRSTLRGDAENPRHPGLSNIYRSENGGRTWQPTLFQHPEQPGYNISNTSWNTGMWGWQQPPSGLAVAPSAPDIVIAGTPTAVVLSKDGGRTWRQVHAPDGTPAAQPGGGLQMMSVWNYYFDPHNHDRRFLASTDFSGWRATRDGILWSYNIVGNPWHNNSYALAFDPAIKDKLWAAASITHDIPTWRYQKDIGNYIGGVVLSTDGGRTWTSRGVNNGLPGRSVTDIWLDPRSAANARHLWAAVPGHGAYFSDDDGRTWQQRNNGFRPENLNVLRIIATPSADRLYALTTIRLTPQGRQPGALYTSTDNGHTWQQLWHRPGVVFPNWITVDPHNPRTLYLSALSRTPAPDATDGGTWRSTDGGQSWEPVFPYPTYAVSIDPRNPGHIYASSWARSGDGLHFSDDNGKTWRRLTGYPFWRPMIVAFDPKRTDRIYVTNFGAGTICGVIKK
ncbi:sialidase family protein [Geminisphaera colitermitum]|uniref:sialidase family protein n=1 Tax=Geminisphaera colitermitum TaxID=1148786 RepID=UPI000158C62A|nr:sialidase family protein [Geminisphaera colitermitum]